MMILFWLIIGLAIFYFSKNSTTNTTDNNIRKLNKKSPEEILKERFAKGEIDEETYIRMKKIIENEEVN